MTKQISETQKSIKNYDDKTDMLVDLLANSEKLTGHGNRWEYNKNQSEINSIRKPKCMSEIKTEYDKNYESEHYDKYNTQKNNFTEHILSNNHEKIGTNTDFNNQYYGDVKKTSEELKLEKFDMIRKLAELKQYGVKLSQQYTMDSDINIMKFEYQLHTGIRAKKNAINWMSSSLLNIIMLLEFGSEKYNPFDIKLKGWAEQMNAESANYYDVFGELYEKYNDPGSKGMPPELKLMLMISGSAMKFHLSNKMMDMIPGLEMQSEVDPELIEKFRQQAVIEKLKRDTCAKNTAFNNKAQEEHNIAAQKALEIKMLQEKEIEFLQQQKYELEKKAKYESLKNQLNESSQSNNEIPIIKPPQISENMKTIFGDIFNSKITNIAENESSSFTSTHSEVTNNIDSIIKTETTQNKKKGVIKII